MDFHSLARRDLQALCKKNHIAANMTNIAMADALQSLQTVEGIDCIGEASSKKLLRSPSPEWSRTCRRSSSRRPQIGSFTISKEDPDGMDAMPEEGPTPATQGSPLPRSRRVAARASEIERMVLEGEEEEPGKVVFVEIPPAPAASARRSTRAKAAAALDVQEVSTPIAALRRASARKLPAEGAERMPLTPAGNTGRLTRARAAAPEENAPPETLKTPATATGRRRPPAATQKQASNTTAKSMDGKQAGSRMTTRRSSTAVSTAAVGRRTTTRSMAEIKMASLSRGEEGEEEDGKGTTSCLDIVGDFCKLSLSESAPEFRGNGDRQAPAVIEDEEADRSANEVHETAIEVEEGREEESPIMGPVMVPLALAGETPLMDESKLPEKPISSDVEIAADGLSPADSPTEPEPIQAVDIVADEELPIGNSTTVKEIDGDLDRDPGTVKIVAPASLSAEEPNSLLIEHPISQSDSPIGNLTAVKEMIDDLGRNLATIETVESSAEEPEIPIGGESITSDGAADEPLPPLPASPEAAKSPAEFPGFVVENIIASEPPPLPLRSSGEILPSAGEGRGDEEKTAVEEKPPAPAKEELEKMSLRKLRALCKERIIVAPGKLAGGGH